MEIAVATFNKGKIKEIQSFFKHTKYKVISPLELGIDIKTIEDGNSFVNNAIIKAKAFGRIAKKVTLADDSGLEIDFLNGEPGVDSAVYLGENADYSERLGHILDRMKGVPSELRSARFVCVIAIYEPLSGEVHTVSAALEGFISLEPKGENGFGYDPIFYVPEFGKTTAELNLGEKNKISHRGKALRLALEKLDEIFG